VVAATAWWLLSAPPAPVERSLPRAGVTSTTTAAVSSGSGARPVTSAPAAGPTTVVVHVVGAVVRPGVVTVAAGGRVADAVAAAGGPGADAELAGVNLAARLADGQRIVVPRVGQVVAALPVVAGVAGDGRPSEPLDLNEATQAQLEDLPGVGPATASAILAQRDRVGRFLRVEDLLEVRGIGPARLEDLRSRVRV
jgi:competence protein ComEA